MQTFVQRAHQGPMFFPFHRYMLLRLEADLREVLDDPHFMMPYWDWDSCQNDDACPELFDGYLGGPGACGTTAVEGGIKNSAPVEDG